MDSIALKFDYAFFVITSYTLCKSSHRISPIANLPGRKLAASTLWHQFYFDVIKRGTYVWQIKDMHEEDGAIVVMFVQSVPKVGFPSLVQSISLYELIQVSYRPSGTGVL